VCVCVLSEGSVNVKDIVEHVRTQRSGMVQTSAQYKFLYDIIPHIIQAQSTVSLSVCLVHYQLVPPRKLRSKNPKVALNLWQKLHKKIIKVALKLRTILHIFGCKILLWSIITFWQRTTKQRLSISCRPNEVQKLDNWCLMSMLCDVSASLC